MNFDTHHLKIWPEYFEPIRCGLKTFEKRAWDRDFKVNDVLALHEWVKDSEEFGHYTGRELTARITYILDGPLAINGVCLMSVKVIQ